MSSARTLRVMLIAEDLSTSGVTSYCQNLVRALVSAGHRLMLVSPGGAHAEHLGKLAERQLVMPWLTRRLWLPVTARRLAPAAAAFHPEVVHALSGHAARAAGTVCRRLGLPEVITAHHFLNHPGELPLNRYVRGVLAVSQSLRENLVNTGKVPRELVTVVPNGIDLTEYAVAPRRSPAGRTIPVVGFFGRLTPRKGPEYLVRAAAELAKTGLEAEYLFVGEGPERGRLQRLAAELGVRNRVTFREGYFEGREVLPALDVFVAPSLQEALGIGILEAMACGIPVVASGVGGVFAIVRDGENGLLAPPRDAAALAARIRELLLNPTRRAEIARAGRETVERQFSLGTMLAGTEAAYAAALEKGVSQVPGR